MWRATISFGLKESKRERERARETERARERDTYDDACVYAYVCVRACLRALEMWKNYSSFVFI